MLFKSLMLSFCFALAGVAAGTIVFFLVHTDDTGEPVQATLQITREWTTETRSDLNSIGAWFTRVEESPRLAAGVTSNGSALAEGDARDLEARGLQTPRKSRQNDREFPKRWPGMMTLGAPSN